MLWLNLWRHLFISCMSHLWNFNLLFHIFAHIVNDFPTRCFVTFILHIEPIGTCSILTAVSLFCKYQVVYDVNWCDVTYRACDKYKLRALLSDYSNSFSFVFETCLMSKIKMVYELSLCFRNNLTILDLVMVQGQGAQTNFNINGNAPGGKSSVLLFEIKPVHLKDCNSKPFYWFVFFLRY